MYTFMLSQSCVDWRADMNANEAEEEEARGGAAHKSAYLIASRPD